ncbi:hypothetical protein TNIN_156811 [Trichonephila inaurata madagascariensis]|uniref:Uncharacterized protein n=1 Tax=Trichonephila inaurata madagascariensis TaxID=2747483 RepID=A0A8X6YIH5_9ARAC|nr:hypothetical protein TNIN_156811 [Trichonephila inaurata madagascariensis]
MYLPGVYTPDVHRSFRPGTSSCHFEVASRPWMNAAQFRYDHRDVVDRLEKRQDSMIYLSMLGFQRTPCRIQAKTLC